MGRDLVASIINVTFRLPAGREEPAPDFQHLAEIGKEGRMPVGLVLLG